MEVNKKYGPYALQLYLYFAKNANGYCLELSQRAALDEAGIRKTSYHTYLELLIKEGYLVKCKGNTYDFYETPHKQEEKDVGRPPSGELSSPWGEQANSSDGGRSSSDEPQIP